MMLNEMMMEDGDIKIFCIEIFKNAKSDYFYYMDRMNDMKKTKRQRKFAEKNVKDLENSFLSGAMDDYTVAFLNINAGDIWRGIVFEYNQERRMCYETT